jgi:hypothetical protein
MKQYHDTVAQLRLWRRYIDEVTDDDGGSNGKFILIEMIVIQFLFI